MKNPRVFFTNIGTVTDAIKQCNSMGNKCNRFIHKNNTMTVVSLTGDTIESLGNHMFVRQNGITFQGQGNPNNSYTYVNVQGENTSITSTSGTFSSTGTNQESNSTVTTGMGY